MIPALVLIVLAVLAVLCYFVREHKTDAPALPSDPEADLRAAIELHRISRRLESSWLKTQQRQEAARIRRRISEALDETKD